MENFLLNNGEDLQYLLFFGGLGAFLLVERLIPRRRPADPQGKRWMTNGVLTLLAILALPLVPISFVAAAFWAQDAGFGLLNQWGHLLPTGFVIFLTLVLRGFISFATHFLNHRVPLLWRLHRVHHMDTELDVSSTVRFHPLEMPVSALIGLPLVVVFGLTPWVLVIYELLDVVVTLFSHSNTRLAPWLNRFLRYVIVTPDLHRVHHSSYQPETDSNYSAVFPIWDLLFGTFRTQTRAPQETMPLGLEEARGDEVNNVFWLLASPVLRLPASAKSFPGAQA